MGFIAKQRMIPLVLALPDQPRQIILAIEHRIHPQPVWASRYNPRHHRPGKVHRPKTGREPLHKPTLPPVPAGSQMKCHIETTNCPLPSGETSETWRPCRLLAEGEGLPHLGSAQSLPSPPSKSEERGVGKEGVSTCR